jgi:hypothetical protein
MKDGMDDDAAAADEGDDADDAGECGGDLQQKVEIIIKC